MTQSEKEEIADMVAVRLSRNGRTWLPLFEKAALFLTPLVGAVIIYLKQNSTHDLVNSRMTELLQITKREGKQEGREEDKPGRPVNIAPGDEGLAKAMMEFLKKYEQK